MNDYSKIQKEFEDKMKAESILVEETFKNQEQLNQNLKILLERLSLFEGQLEGLKDSKYNKVSMIFKQNKLVSKPSELIKMNFDQLVKNKDKHFQKNSFKNSMIFFDEQSKENPALQIQVSNPVTLNKIDKDFENRDFINDKVQFLLMEKKYEQAIKELQLLLDDRSLTGYENFLKVSKLKVLVTDEISICISSLQFANLVFNAGTVSPYIDYLFQLKEYNKAVDSTLKLFSCLINQKSSKERGAKRFEAFFKTAEELFEFLKAKFSGVFLEKEYLFPFHQMLEIEFSNIVKVCLEELDAKAAKIEYLENLIFDLSDYELKGFSFDYVIQNRIEQLNFEESAN